MNVSARLLAALALWTGPALPALAKAPPAVFLVRTAPLRTLDRLGRTDAISRLPASWAERHLSGLPAVTARGGMVEAVPPGARVSAAYLTLVNSSDEAVKLLGGSSPLAARVTPMKTTRGGAGNMVGMRAATLVIPARGTLTLSATGDHLMLEGLRHVPKIGETVKLTLKLSPGQSLVLALPVRRLP